MVIYLSLNELSALINVTWIFVWYPLSNDSMPRHYLWYCANILLVQLHVLISKCTIATVLILTVMQSTSNAKHLFLNRFSTYMADLIYSSNHNDITCHCAWHVWSYIATICYGYHVPCLTSYAREIFPCCLNIISDFTQLSRLQVTVTDIACQRHRWSVCQMSNEQQTWTTIMRCRHYYNGEAERLI